MEALLDSIRIALSDGASDDERRRGLAACYGLAHALEGSLARGAATLRDFRPTDDATEVVAAEVVTADELARATFNDREPRVAESLAIPIAPNPFAGMTADQILDSLITRLRGVLGDEPAPLPAGPPFRITLVPVPRVP